MPFTYELRTDRPWQEGAVLVLEEPITMEVPSDINLIAKALETYEMLKHEEMERYAKKVAQYNENIRQLQLLEGPKVTDHLERIEDIIMRRDHISYDEATELVQEARRRVQLFGEDPEEILHDEFGLEPDFVFQLLE